MRRPLHFLVLVATFGLAVSAHALSNYSASVSDNTLTISANTTLTTTNFTITRSGTVYTVVANNGGGITATSPVVSTGSNSVELDTSTTTITDISVDLGQGSGRLAAGTAVSPMDVALTFTSDGGTMTIQDSGGIYSSADVTVYGADIRLGIIDASGASITLTAAGGDIRESSNDAATDLVATTITLNADEGVFGSSDSEALEIDATGSADGEGLSVAIPFTPPEEEPLTTYLTLEDTSGELRIESIDLDFVEVDIKGSASSSTINIESLAVVEADVVLEAGDVNVDYLFSTDSVSITSTQGNIREYGDDAAADIVANKISLSANDTLGDSSNYLEIDTTSLSNSRGLFINFPNEESAYLAAVDDLRIESITGPTQDFNLTVSGDLYMEAFDLGTGTANFSVTGSYHFVNSNSFLTSDGFVLSSSDSFTYDVKGGGSSSTRAVTANISGTVDLGSATLVIDVNESSLPSTGNTFTLLSNDGADPILGTFDGLVEGATVTGDNGFEFSISYVGGDGNDIVLTTTTDTVAPELVSITPATYGPTTDTSIEYTFVFSEDMMNFTSSDILRNTSGSNSSTSYAISGSGTTWTVTATFSPNSDLFVILGIFRNRTITDLAGNHLDLGGPSGIGVGPVTIAASATGYTNYIAAVSGATPGVDDGYEGNFDGDAYNNLAEYLFDLDSDVPTSGSDFDGKFLQGITSAHSVDSNYRFIIPVPTSMVFGSNGNTVNGTIDSTLDIYLAVSGYSTPGGTPDRTVVVNTAPDTSGLGLPALNAGYQYVEFYLQDDLGVHTSGFLDFNVTTEDPNDYFSFEG